MDVTVFYAWQSDRPQNTHRYLIRDAAKDAVKRIGSDVEVEESPRLDHDTKDVPGAPEIAGTILKKIQESSAFIADLTFIGTTELHNGRRKLLPNPNVIDARIYLYAAMRKSITMNPDLCFTQPALAA